MRRHFLRPSSWLLCAAWLASCASLGPNVEILPPNDGAASQPVAVVLAADFVEIPPGACVPPFEAGVFVSFDSANALVYANRKREHEHKLKLLDLEERAVIAEGKEREAQRQVAALDSWWERYKFWIGLGAGAVLTGGAFVSGAMLMKR